MANVFLLYMPPGNAQAMVNYENTIKQKVELDRIAAHVSDQLQRALQRTFGNARVAVWGSRAGPTNRRNFELMKPGDDVVVVEGDSIRLIGKVAEKVESPSLSRALWPSLTGKVASWELIYFIANPRELDVPFTEFCALFGYKRDLQLRGFLAVAPARLAAFHEQYDDLYSILLRIQRGEPVAQRSPDVTPLAAPAPELVDVSAEELDEALRSPVISDHVRMQWTLAKLGLKAGERVWVPVADRLKLRRAYDFDAADEQFSAGIDLPHSYIENIDVVWRQEFRIGAAYEIENSTSIYSGLLRFADLNIIAPNTLYPIFIVAPQERRGRLREQLRRPTFKRLDLDSKVRFLSYESIDEIDRFFSGSKGGLSVDLILSRAEVVG